MSEAKQPRYGVDPYLDWVEAEGLPVTEDYGIDLFHGRDQPCGRATASRAPRCI